MTKRFWVLLLALVLAAGLLSAVGVVSARRSASQAGSSEWTTIFSDTFTTAQPVWTFEDPWEKGYEWDVVTYTRSIDGDLVEDRGLWAAGGGSLGSAQSWATGTYTHNMQTLAVAGPFTLTQPAASLRLTAQVLNKSHLSGDPGDTLLIEVSPDGKSYSPDARPVPIDAASWQTITREAGPFDAGDQVYIYLRFLSDGEGVDTGPLVDDIRLEMLAKHDIYLPLVRLDPTPTPVPIFHDPFSDPNSGWFTGWAQRFNWYTDYDGVYHEGWQDVAQMSYRDGSYRIYVPMDYRGRGDVDTWFVWPAEMAPLPAEMKPLPDNFCIETHGRIANGRKDALGDPQPYWAHWGIVFGANENRADDDPHPSEIYTFQINSHGQVGIVGYHNHVYPGNRDARRTHENIEWQIYDWPGTGSYFSGSFGRGIEYPATLRVEVVGENARFFVDGREVAAANIAGMPRNQIGLIGGSFEITPVEIEFDYFHYEPNCAAP